jgi:diketogulonate reductase-like aldo/keto reductase
LTGSQGTAPLVVTLAWLLQLGIIVIPASANRQHIEANLRAGDVQRDGRNGGA